VRLINIHSNEKLVEFIRKHCNIVTGLEDLSFRRSIKAHPLNSNIISREDVYVSLNYHSFEKAEHNTDEVDDENLLFHDDTHDIYFLSHWLNRNHIFYIEVIMSSSYQKLTYKDDLDNHNLIISKDLFYKIGIYSQIHFKRKLELIK